jgi:hypothetical protein
MHATLVRFDINREVGTPGMTKQRLIKILVVLEIMLIAALLWVMFK